MRRFALPVAVGLLLMAAPNAMATSYFATPSDGVHNSPGGPCDINKPCSLEVTLDSDHAKPDDDVTLLPGTYQLGGTLFVPNRVTLHGQPGAPRPIIALDNTNLDVVIDMTLGTVLRHLEIVGKTKVATVALRDATVEDTIMRQLNPGTIVAAGILGSAVRNSVIHKDATGVQGFVAAAGPTELRNTTITGNADSGSAVVARCPPQGVQGAGNFAGQVTVINTIAQPGAGKALSADGSSLQCVNGYLPEIHARSSAFDRLQVEELAGGRYFDEGDNVGPASLGIDGIHQLAGSTTIDAGKVDALSAIDWDGGPRISGSAVDIGADEFVPPPPPPAPPTPPAPPVQTFQSPIAPVFLPVKPIPAGLSGLTVTGTKTTSKVPPTAHFTLDVAQKIPFRVSALLSGRIRKGKCISPAGKTGKPCKAVRQFFSGTITASRGENTIGLLTSKSSQLPPGLYRLTMSPSGQSAKTAEFRVLTGSAKKKTTKKKK